MKYYNIALALAGMVLAGVAGLPATGARAQPPERICDKAKMAEIDFYTCEGMRLRSKGQLLLRQARTQISEGQRIIADCARLEDTSAARDCNLMSSDLQEDAAFKQAEAADLLNQAERMESRAADMDKAKR